MFQVSPINSNHAQILYRQEYAIISHKHKKIINSSLLRSNCLDLAIFSQATPHQLFKLKNERNSLLTAKKQLVHMKKQSHVRRLHACETIAQVK